MAITLHTCGNPWLGGPHPCGKVRKALDDAGIAYENVKHPSIGRGRRKDLIARTGQDRLPVIEFEDGRIYREESADMVARIQAGKLFADEAPVTAAAGEQT